MGVRNKLTPVEGVFYWWGRLCAHKSPSGQFPAKATHFISFIAPKIRKMGFTIAEQSNLLSAFLVGVYKIFWREAKSELHEFEEDSE